MANFDLKGFRTAKGLKQYEIAEVLKMTQSNLSRVESNDIDLTDEQLNALTAKFGKEEIEQYRVSGTFLEDTNKPRDERMDDLLRIIRRQSDTICQQSDILNKITETQANTNDRLLTLLEKLSFQ